MNHDDIRLRCENWGAWARGDHLTRTANSFEGQYRSPQSGHWKVPVPTWAPPVDVLDARAIEHAVCVIPIYHHAILRGWYCFRLSEPVVLRKAARAADEPRGRTSGWTSTLEMAHALLEGALALPATIRRERTRAIVVMALSLDDDEPAVAE